MAGSNNNTFNYCFRDNNNYNGKSAIANTIAVTPSTTTSGINTPASSASSACHVEDVYHKCHKCGTLYETPEQLANHLEIYEVSIKFPARPSPSGLPMNIYRKENCDWLTSGLIVSQYEIENLLIELGKVLTHYPRTHRFVCPRRCTTKQFFRLQDFQYHYNKRMPLSLLCTLPTRSASLRTRYVALTMG